MPTPLKISFNDIPKTLTGKGSLVITVGASGQLGTVAKALDKKTGGQITTALKVNPRYKGNQGETLVIHAPHGQKFSRIILLGLGKLEKDTSHDLQVIGASAYNAVANTGDTHALIIIDDAKKLDPEQIANLAGGMQLRGYRFDKYRTTLKAEQKPSLTTVAIASAKSAAVKKAYKDVAAVVDGLLFTRNMGFEPPNIMYPKTAAQTVAQLRKVGVKVEIIDDKKLKKMGFGCLLAVAQGSDKPARVVVMQYNGAKNKKAKPLALVGKGVTYDTGGYSLKPAAGQIAKSMKYDMMGASVVTGTIRALAMRKAKVNVVGVVGFVENMISGNAYRPWDVVKSLSGQSVEILNTDAEGRLVLCDCLTYVQNRFKPEEVINLATLTGAISVALGEHYAGMFSNDDGISTRLTKAGKSSGDRLWRLPLGPEYNKELDTAIADMKHIGDGNAGSTTAACFLERFIQKGVKWAHLDIAGVSDLNNHPLNGPKGATGFGVRLLNQYVVDNYE
ncbi:MAG: leucyl aminopeptidase [Bdellovibrionales bacterium]